MGSRTKRKRYERRLKNTPFGNQTDPRYQDTAQNGSARIRTQAPEPVTTTPEATHIPMPEAVPEAGSALKSILLEDIIHERLFSGGMMSYWTAIAVREMKARANAANVLGSDDHFDGYIKEIFDALFDDIICEGNMPYDDEHTPWKDRAKQGYSGLASMLLAFLSAKGADGAAEWLVYFISSMYLNVPMSSEYLKLLLENLELIIERMGKATGAKKAFYVIAFLDGVSAGLTQILSGLGLVLLTFSWYGPSAGLLMFLGVNALQALVAPSGVAYSMITRATGVMLQDELFIKLISGAYGHLKDKYYSEHKTLYRAILDVEYALSKKEIHAEFSEYLSELTKPTTEREAEEQHCAAIKKLYELMTEHNVKPADPRFWKSLWTVGSVAFKLGMSVGMFFMVYQAWEKSGNKGEDGIKDKFGIEEQIGWLEWIGSGFVKWGMFTNVRLYMQAMYYIFDNVPNLFRKLFAIKSEMSTAEKIKWAVDLPATLLMAGISAKGLFNVADTPNDTHTFLGSHAAHLYASGAGAGIVNLDAAARFKQNFIDEPLQTVTPKVLEKGCRLVERGIRRAYTSGRVPNVKQIRVQFKDEVSHLNKKGLRAWIKEQLLKGNKTVEKCVLSCVMRDVEVDAAKEYKKRCRISASGVRVNRSEWDVHLDSARGTVAKYLEKAYLAWRLPANRDTTRKIFREYFGLVDDESITNVIGNDIDMFKLTDSDLSTMMERLKKEYRRVHFGRANDFEDMDVDVAGVHAGAAHGSSSQKEPTDDASMDDKAAEESVATGSSVDSIASGETKASITEEDRAREAAKYGAEDILGRKMANLFDIGLVTPELLVELMKRAHEEAKRKNPSVGNEDKPHSHTLFGMSYGQYDRLHGREPSWGEYFRSHLPVWCGGRTQDADTEMTEGLMQNDFQL